MKTYKWVGSERTFIDDINILELDHMVVGRFGGNSSAGQTKNEDGCLVWVNLEEGWEFAVILDAHDSTESAELVVTTIDSMKQYIMDCLTEPLPQSFKSMETNIVETFQSKAFLEKCKQVKGETACLFVARKQNYLWWLSIGDCPLYVHHPELARLSEYQQNHRSFFEWIGKNSTFHQGVPSYSSGIKQLRQGETHIFMTTDGLIECPNTSYSNPEEIFKMFKAKTTKNGVQSLLEEIAKKGVRDSTTILSWKVYNEKDAVMPSDS
ncbi:protein phosphatase 2C domain-containing protein [Radiobacillus deserti]|uniref:Protein phosphatase 2C domain-containing protein n=1 Tax=Radiobacillus deserti TaxID=2594883 RepID=A0A516KDB2_9BACI|nr:protein phosphatase 2C domain-containing protein [Radiobacillus deserti]QDP39403.1 protein phosphatase 2C domain-containing protein [Radiobacillus deserti]